MALSVWESMFKIAHSPPLMSKDDTKGGEQWILREVENQAAAPTSSPAGESASMEIAAGSSAWARISATSLTG